MPDEKPNPKSSGYVSCSLEHRDYLKRRGSGNRAEGLRLILDADDESLTAIKTMRTELIYHEMNEPILSLFATLFFDVFRWTQVNSWPDECARVVAEIARLREELAEAEKQVHAREARQPVAVAVSERLPDDWTTVLVLDYGVWCSGYRDSGAWKEGIGRELDSVSHWTPLPDHPIGHTPPETEEG